MQLQHINMHTLEYYILYILYIRIYHHTRWKLQCVFIYICLCPPVNGQGGIQKVPPVQVADDDHHRCKLCFCISWWQEKHHQRKLQWVKTISETSRCRMQQTNAGSTRASFDYIGFLPFCKLRCCLLYPAPTSFQDGLDPLQFALVFFLPCCDQLMQEHNVHPWWSSPATCTGGVFCMPPCPFTGLHKYIWARLVTFTLWWCLWFVVIRVRVCVVHLWCCCRVLCVCVCACVCVWGKETTKKKEIEDNKSTCRERW